MALTEREKARKLKDKQKARAQFEGGLYKVLFKAFPGRRTLQEEVFDVKWLAEKLSISTESIYKWIRADKLPLRRAREILKLKGCRVTLEDFFPHVY